MAAVDADTVLKGLLNIPSHAIAAAERCHMLFRAGNEEVKRGRVHVTAEHCRARADVLTPVLEQLCGRQPAAVAYCQAMQQLDVAHNRSTTSVNIMPELPI
jgi:hypothetical protein